MPGSSFFPYANASAAERPFCFWHWLVVWSRGSRDGGAVFTVQVLGRGVPRETEACMRSVLRILPLALFVAWAMWAAPVAADDRANPHEVKVVSAANGKLTMTDKDGKNEHSHQVAEDAEITCD